MTSKLAMALLVAALMVLPQALAVTTVLSGPAGQASSAFNSVAGSSVDVKNTLGANSLTTSAAMSSITGLGDLRIYNEWVSWDFNEKAAAYAYLANSGSFTYNIAGTSGSKSASASLKISATDADDFFFGGYAYNPTNYAGTFASGDWADKVTYKNTLFASSSMAKAGETFYGTGFTTLEASTWAEKGLGDYEVKDEAGVLSMWNNLDPRSGYYGYVYDPTTLASTEGMTLSAGDISSSQKPYTASASASSTGAASSQSVVLSDGATGTLTLFSDATTGDTTFGYYGLTYLSASGLTAKPNNVVYSASAKAALNGATARQNVDVKKADNIYKMAYAQSYDESFVASESMNVGSGGSGIASSLKGSDSASASAASTVVDQKSTASGADHNKFTYGFDAVGNYYSHSTIDIALSTAIKASTLTGSSTTMASAKGVSILSPTKWKAAIANGATATRSSLAFSDLGTITITDPMNGNYQFADRTRATQTTIQAL